MKATSWFFLGGGALAVTYLVLRSREEAAKSQIANIQAPIQTVEPKTSSDVLNQGPPPSDVRRTST
jgi:hypothetical protein